ncbi:YbfB/YjiJ family MFS transporter [Streptomyces sp. NPDC059866]|uniref:YbfB/YjiJ family MFS transporter n=1 Tax=Streptomyces sp. NPDC059866 TaxID=3346978 RepID=UPI0036476BD3
MGVGHFVYTPVLPLMHTQAGLSAAAGANPATADHVGHLVGALADILAPPWSVRVPSCAARCSC